MDRSLHFFVSDVHLGLEHKDPSAREARFCRFLKQLPENTKSLYLLGDIFDFWYEYRYVVPAGHVRVLGALAELVDKGIDVCFLKGNHDMWTFGYLENEIGVRVLEEPLFVELEGKRFCMAHGDTLGKVDPGYRLLHSVFTSRIARGIFSCIHPRWAFGLARVWSRSSRLAHEVSDYRFELEKTPAYSYAESVAGVMDVSYFVFGHYHRECSGRVGSRSEIFMLGEWVNGTGAAVFDGTHVRMLEAL